MIINPIEGMRVIGKRDARDGYVRNRRATIINIDPILGFDFQVNFDDRPMFGISGRNTWFGKVEDFELEIPPSPEEQAHQEDQLRRQKHAMRFL